MEKPIILKGKTILIKEKKIRLQIKSDLIPEELKEPLLYLNLSNKSIISITEVEGLLSQTKL